MSLSTQRQEIFSYLDGDDVSLFAVIRVSKVCYHGCIGMLWRKSTQKRLVKVLQPERRQHYANMIYRWELDDSSSRKLVQNAWPQQRFVGGSPVARPFPSIEDLTICGETPTISALLSSFPPTLVSLDLDVNDKLYNILPTVGRLSNLIYI